LLGAGHVFLLLIVILGTKYGSILTPAQCSHASDAMSSIFGRTFVRLLVYL
jgi:hypothetical protein